MLGKSNLRETLNPLNCKSLGEKGSEFHTKLFILLITER